MNAFALRVGDETVKTSGLCCNLACRRTESLGAHCLQTRVWVGAFERALSLHSGAPSSQNFPKILGPGSSIYYLRVRLASRPPLGLAAGLGRQKERVIDIAGSGALSCTLDGCCLSKEEVQLTAFNESCLGNFASGRLRAACLVVSGDDCCRVRSCPGLGDDWPPGRLATQGSKLHAETATATGYPESSAKQASRQVFLTEFRLIRT